MSATTPDPATAYARDVVAGRVVAGRLVRLACERHVRDLAEGPARGLRWDPAAAGKAIGFFGFLTHSKGEWAGKTLSLSPWQAFIVGSIFGWKKTSDLTRRFRMSYVEVPRKNGKAMHLDTPVPTPDGWKKHGDLRPGDFVFGPDGRPCQVEAVTAPYSGPCYRVGFSDGTEVIAHAAHEWKTKRTWYTKRARGSRDPLPLMETIEIAQTLRGGSRGDLIHGIDVAAPLNLPAAVLPVPPYTFGAWLGDGNSASARITSADPEVLAAIRAEGVPVSEAKAVRGQAGLHTLSTGYGGKRGQNVQARLRALAVLKDKHIPTLYLRASREQRLEILRGLMDTDGHVTAKGQCELVLVNLKLFRDAVELVRSLGYKPTVTKDVASIKGRVIGPRYRMQFWAWKDEPVLRLSRKAARLRAKPTKAARSSTRMIVAADPVGDHMVNCIQVEGGMYLVGEGMVPTHNSTFAAGVGLYLAFFDGEAGAEVYTAATKREQARIVHSEAVRMVRASQSLRKRISIFKDNLSSETSNSKYEPLGADANTLDGLNPHGVIVDELHAHKTRDMLDVLETATGARRSPLIFIITTAGVAGGATVCQEMHDYGAKIMEGQVEADNQFVYIASIDDGDDWKDEKVWGKANPNLGISCKLDDMRAKCAKAIEMPSAQATFRQKHLDQWVQSIEVWLPDDRWSSPANSAPLDLASLKGRECYGGLDLANTLDLCAFVLVFPKGEEKPIPRRRARGEEEEAEEGPTMALAESYDALAWFWVPEACAEERERTNRVNYRTWIDLGLIQETSGDVTDYDAIRADLGKIGEDYQIKEIAYDPFNATQLANQLVQDGFEMFAFRQNMANFNEPMTALEKLAKEGRVHHGGHLVLRWMVGNVFAVRNGVGDVMPSRKKSTDKIDGAVALIQGLARAMMRETGGSYLSVI